MNQKDTTKRDIKSSLTEDLNEPTVRERCVYPYMKDILGWPVENIVHEYTVHKNGKEADYATSTGNEAEFLVEAKSIDTDIKKQRTQLSEYLDLSDVDYGLLTNGIEFELMKRKEDSSNIIVDTFQLTDPHPEKIDFEGSKSAGEDNIKEFYHRIVNDAPIEINTEILDSITLQYFTGLNHNTEPIHNYISVDETMIRSSRELLYNICQDVIIVKNENKESTLMESSVNPNLILYDNIEGDSTFDKSMVSELSSVEKDKIHGLPSDTPIIILDSPKEGILNDYDAITEQIDISISAMQSFDLIFTIEDSINSVTDTKVATERLEEESPEERVWGLTPEVSDLDDLELKFSKESTDYIRDFYVSIRSDTRNDGVPLIGNSKIDSLWNITKTIALVESEGSVEKTHAERAKEIVMCSLKDIGYDKRAERFNIDTTETNHSTTQKHRRNTLRRVIKKNEDEGDKGTPYDLIIEIMTQEYDFDEDSVNFDLRKLSREGEKVYEPTEKEYATI